MLSTNHTSSSAGSIKPPSKAALEQAIAHDEQKLKEALGQIEQAVKRQVSLKERIRSQPFQALSVAFFSGLVLGISVLAPKSSSTLPL